MLKKALAKSLAGTLVAAGLLVPASVVGGAELALMAKKTGCTYDTSQTTTTTLSASPTQLMSGSTVSGSSTVTPGAGNLPSGTLTITAYPYTGTTYSTTGTVLGSKTVTNSDRTLTYSNSTLPGNNTYRFEAKYTTTNCDYADSTSPSRYVSVYKYDTTTTVTSSGKTYTATVSAPRRSSDSTVPVVAGTVRFTEQNNGGQLNTTDVELTASRQAQFTVGNQKTFVSAEYLGNTYYNSSITP